MLSAIPMIVEYRLDYGQLPTESLGTVNELLDYVIDNYERFVVDNQWHLDAVHPRKRAGVIHRQEAPRRGSEWLGCCNLLAWLTEQRSHDQREESERDGHNCRLAELHDRKGRIQVVHVLIRLG